MRPSLCLISSATPSRVGILGLLEVRRLRGLGFCRSVRRALATVAVNSLSSESYAMRRQWVLLCFALPQAVLAFSAGGVLDAGRYMLAARARSPTSRQALSWKRPVMTARVTGKQLASEFSSWLLDRGCRGICSVVSVRESSMGGWGIFAEADISKGDAVLVLPLGTCLSEESVECSELREEFDEISDALQELYGFSSETPHGCPFIAVQLLLHLQQGSASDWAPYINMLPRERRAGWRWSASGLPKFLKEDSAAVRKSIEREFAHLDRRVFQNHRSVFGAEHFTLEQYCWAKDMVLSRAYAVEGDLGGLACLLPGIDMANHATDVEYGVRQLALDEALSVPAGEGWAADDRCIDDAEEFVGLIADRNYKSGEEVWSNYGPLDKSRL